MFFNKPHPNIHLPASIFVQTTTEYAAAATHINSAYMHFMKLFDGRHGSRTAKTWWESFNRGLIM